MEREAVESSQVVSVGYDSGAQALEVEFAGGAVYQYAGVPDHVHREMLAADSVGRYLNVHIKGAFPYERVS